MIRFKCDFQAQLLLLIIFTLVTGIISSSDTFDVENQSQHGREQNQEDLIFPSGAVRRYAHVESGTYFGYSVAAYVGQSQSFCLVGAPQARLDGLGDVTLSLDGNTHPDQPTGLVYRLDLDPNLPYCSLVPIATTDEMRKEYGTPTPGISSWLGGSVAAASNSLNRIQLGCDPRYVYAPNLINQTASAQGASGSGGTRSARTMLGTGQCALYTGASMQYTPVDACLTQEEGACLSGFSADVEAGLEFGEALVALGMPGSYLTEGNVFLGHYRGLELLNAVRLKSSPEDLKHQGFNLGYAVALAELIRRPSTPGGTESETGQPEWARRDARPTGNNGPSASILTSSSMWIDNDYRGIVMILDQSMDLNEITYLKDKWGHIGSFFGYSIATADLNGDGIVDIVVGAPYFTERKESDGDDTAVDDIDKLTNTLREARTNAQTLARKLTTKGRNLDAELTVDDEKPEGGWGRLTPDVGRAYVFYGSAPNSSVLGTSGRPDYTSREPVILNGPRLAGGRFGHAVVSLGDVDGDGTDDLAISCPYCTDPHGRPDTGAVFVYLGQKTARITDEPSQVIWAGDLPQDNPLTTCGDFGLDDPGPRVFRSFGWSLSGGADLDGNRAPDIVVGDFESDQVVIIRARNTLWFDNPEWDLPLARTLPWSEQSHFEARLTVSVHGRPEVLRKPSGFRIRVRIDLDALMEQFESKRLLGRDMTDPKLTEQGQNPAGLGVLETVVTVSPANSAGGLGNRLTLLKLRLEPQYDRVLALLWKPIRINATSAPVPEPMAHVSDSSTDPVPAWTLHPFLGQRHFLSRPLRFANPACGADNVCMAELQVHLTDQSRGPTENQIVYFRERPSQRNLTVSIGNLGENAYAASLRLTIPHQFSFTVPENLACESKILVEEKATELICSLGDPLQHTGGRLLPFVFHLNTAGAFKQIDQPLNDAPEPVSGNITETQNLKPEAGRSEDRWANLDQRKRRFGKRTAVSTDVNPSTPPVRESVTIHAEVFSGNDDLDPWNNKASITYKLQLSAKVDLSSSALDRTTIDSRNFTAQLYEMQRVHPETLGPEIRHIYLVSNDGPSPIENLWVNITMPVKTENDEHLVYFLDRVRYHAEDGGPPRIVNMAPEVISAEGHIRGICLTPDWALNPLRLNAVNRSPPTTPGTRQPRWADLPNGAFVTPTDDHDSDTVRTHTYVDPNRPSPTRATRSILPGVRKRQQEIIRCGQESPNMGMPICATIYCRIDSLSRGDAVRIVLRGHAWADTFFRYKIPDLAIVSDARAQLPEFAFGIPVHGNRTIQPLAISQNFVFHGIKVPAFREIPLWPIILGCILGAALLAGIIFGLWRCGFFVRKRDRNTMPPGPNNSHSTGPIISPTLLDKS